MKWKTTIATQYALILEITALGKDLNITLHGGEKSHIGAVALAIPRPSLKDPDKISASVSVITVTGHKEDELARQVAATFARQFNCVVSVSCGIHIDNISQATLEEIIAGVKLLQLQAINELPTLL